MANNSSSNTTVKAAAQTTPPTCARRTAHPRSGLGERRRDSLSPDGKWVISVVNVRGRLFCCQPVREKPGHLDRPGIEDDTDNGWLPDSKRVVFTGREPGKSLRTYIQNMDGSAPHAITRKASLDPGLARRQVPARKRSKWETNAIWVGECYDQDVRD